MKKTKLKTDRRQRARKLFKPDQEMDLAGIQLPSSTYAKLKTLFKSEDTSFKFKSAE